MSNKNLENPVRVIHVLHNMGFGGIENALMNYYRNIDKKKVQFDFLLTAPEEDCHFAQEILSLGGKIFHIPPLDKKNPIKYIRGLNKFFKEHPEYRICHAHSTSKSVIPLYVAKKHGVRNLIAHSHSATQVKGVDGKLIDILKGPLKKVATHWFSCSDLATVFLYGKENINNEKVRVIKNVIDSERFKFDRDKRIRMRNQLGFKDDEIVIGTVGRISPTKNQEFMIDVLAELSNKCDKIKGLIVGEGELEEKLKNYTKQKNLSDKLHFIGGVKNVEDYLSATDIFLLPSIKEGFGMAAIEAQTSGLPCLVSDGVPQECNISGLVKFLPLDADVWVNEILSVIKNPQERVDKVNEIKRAGFDAALTAKQLEDLYLQMVK